jgi:hypothetical protein
MDDDDDARDRRRVVGAAKRASLSFFCATSPRS